MHGNVREWCADVYADDYYGKSPRKDPISRTGSRSRVLRGGAWNSVARSCRSASRSRHTPDYRNDVIGFRVVLAPGPP